LVWWALDRKIGAKNITNLLFAAWRALVAQHRVAVVRDGLLLGQDWNRERIFADLSGASFCPDRWCEGVKDY
jgi:hypothetical protein